jgi:alpha-tubulin suppressor-like RCC1 family protein
MKICLVDSRVTESTIFLTSVQDNVTSILLDYESDSFDSLLAKIGNNVVDSIAYVAYGTFTHTYSFFKDSSFDMKSKDSWQPFFNFLKAINGLQYFDFLGCKLASNNDWKQVFLWIEDDVNGVHIRASVDATGNIASGGNWILEDGSVDAKELYFTNLDNFNSLLDQSYHTVFIKGNALYGCGYNGNGQLGDGTYTDKTTETMFTFNTGVTFSDLFYPVQFACGQRYTIVLMSDYTLWGTGWHEYGQLGIGFLPGPPYQVNINKLTKFDTTSSYYYPTNMLTYQKYPVQIACGYYHTVVLMSDNTLWATGFSTSGQKAGLLSSYALQEMTPPNAGYPVQIACGEYHTFVLMSDNTIWGAGQNLNGQLGLNTNVNVNTWTQMKMLTGTINFSIPYPIKIACGELHTIVLMSDNTIWGAGYNLYGQLGDSTYTDRWILTKMTTNFATNEYPIQIACGQYHTVILTSNDVWGCGNNASDQLSNASIGAKTNILTKFTNRSTNPTLFDKSIRTPININASRNSTCIQMSDMTVYGSGQNQYGELFTTTTGIVHTITSGYIGSRSYINNMALYDGTPKEATVYGNVTTI